MAATATKTVFSNGDSVLCTCMRKRLRLRLRLRRLQPSARLSSQTINVYSLFLE